MEQKTQVAQIRYSSEMIKKIWEKARIIPNFDPDIYRKDMHGAWIKREHFGLDNEDESLGWNIVSHIDDEGKIDSEGELLIPLQWQNASLHQEGYKHGVITASGIFNIKVLTNYEQI